MKEKTGVTIGVIIVILITIAGFRAMFLIPSMHYSEVCKIEHGENWTYEYSEVFGQTCAEVDYLTLEYKKRLKVDFIDEELQNRYCIKTSYWDLRKWQSECQEFVKEDTSEGEK